MVARKEAEFAVSVTKEEVVAAMPPLQQHLLPLSNLDLLLPAVDVGVFFCYKNPSPAAATGSQSNGEMSFGSMIGSLKKALAQALVFFYAFAGEMVQNSAGEPELLCNNRGVDFVEAFADVKLRSLNLYNPDEVIEGKLAPRKKHGVLAIQATSFKCGGLIVACTFDHRVADAYSTNMFLVSWAKMAQPNNLGVSNTHISSLSRQLCFQCSLLSPRCSSSINPFIHDMYVLVSKLPPPKTHDSQDDKLISQIYYITVDELNNMQSLANCNDINGGKHTKLVSFCAFLWKMIAASAKDKNSIAKMGIVVDGRKRLSNGDKDKETLMSSYFGNVLSIPYGGNVANELIEKPLSWIANQVQKFLEPAMTEEHFLGLIDWVEAYRPIQGMAKIYCNGTNDGPGFVVSSGQMFPQSKVDFGWGRPIFGSYHFPWGGDSGYVMPMPSPNGNGDWVVYMHLYRGQLELIESMAVHVFKPFTWDYLKY